MAGESSYRNIIYRLGNQTLLTKSLNRSAKNKEFKYKKAQYEENTGHLTELTKDLLKSVTWNQAAVVKRSESLAKEAAALWNWTALERDLRVTTPRPTERGKRAVKKVRKKKSSRRVRKKSTRKKV